MTNQPHLAKLIIDGKTSEATGKNVILELDGRQVYDSQKLEKYISLSPNHDISDVRTLLKAAEAAFGNANRFQILVSCAEKPEGFTAIKKALEIPPATLNYHLRYLQKAWLLYKNDQGLYTSTLLGNLILEYFSDFLNAANTLKEEIEK
jgi:DNA-binding HxlR family transcriptional regulator